MLWKILEKIFITKKFNQCKTSRILKIDVLQIPDKKYIGKLFSKYELLFLDQVNSSSDPSQILIEQFPIPRTSLPPSPYLSNFILANWNSSSTQSSLCYLSISLFCPTLFNYALPQVLDIPNLMPSQTIQIYYQATYRP